MNITSFLFHTHDKEKTYTLPKSAKFLKAHGKSSPFGAPELVILFFSDDAIPNEEKTQRTITILPEGEHLTVNPKFKLNHIESLTGEHKTEILGHMGTKETIIKFWSLHIFEVVIKYDARMTHC